MSCSPLSNFVVVIMKHESAPGLRMSSGWYLVGAVLPLSFYCNCFCGALPVFVSAVCVYKRVALDKSKNRICVSDNGS